MKKKSMKSATWNQDKDLMKLDIMNKKERTCFKCEKKEYIRRFCKNKEKDLTNLKMKNRIFQIQEENLKKN